VAAEQQAQHICSTILERERETIIPYVITMSSLAMLSLLLEHQLGQMASSRFTDRTLKWWTSLPGQAR
jgi:fucose 4-O-acetylase-like acetyltransferase